MSYRIANKALYLAEPSVEHLDVANLSPEALDKLRKPIDAVARAAFEAFPIYELKGRNMKELTAAHVLRSITVRNGCLLAELGLP